MSRKRREPGPKPERRRFEIQFTRTAERGLAALPRNILRRVDAAIVALAENPRPHGSLKLQGEEDFYRIRVGDYRVIDRVEADRLVVLVVNIGNRRDIDRSL
jgi:mRNA interferase RelE/StbE